MIYSKKSARAISLEDKITGNNATSIIFLVKPSQRMEILRILSKEKFGKIHNIHFVKEGLKRRTIGDANE